MCVCVCVCVGVCVCVCVDSEYFLNIALVIKEDTFFAMNFKIICKYECFMESRNNVP